MKKCASELELEAFIRQHLASAAANRPSQGTDAGAGVFSSHVGGLPVPGLCFGDSQNALELEGSDAGHLWWSDGVCAPHPAASSTMGSQTAAASAGHTETTSGNQALESESDSGTESLIDIEGGRCNRKSTDTKRIRRMVSNRESARRSRRRKHAQLTDLELQVEQLKSESASLFKQLTEANQHFTTAVTDNRILLSTSGAPPAVSARSTPDARSAAASRGRWALRGSVQVQPSLLRVWLGEVGEGGFSVGGLRLPSDMGFFASTGLRRFGRLGNGLEPSEALVGNVCVWNSSE